MSSHRCLFCNAELTHLFADLGTCPPSNAFFSAEQCEQPEIFLPLQAWVCQACLLVQVPRYKAPEEIFTPDYPYHSSNSHTWVDHAKELVQTCAKRFSLGQQSFIIEVASNDGYLLQHAVTLGIPCLGIEPSTGTASVAQAKGIPTLTDFFTESLAAKLAEQDRQADLICGLNVFAHVPDINDFTAGLARLLKPEGVVVLEFPHLLRLVEGVQFDTIYHEHYFYFSLSCAQKILEAHGLRLFDVEEMPTHGGSLRVYACHAGAKHQVTERIGSLLAQEKAAGIGTLEYYLAFQEKIVNIKLDLLQFLLDARRSGKKICGYGAAAKGNTLLNYFGIRKDILPFVADISPHKQGKFLPGSRIPVSSVDELREYKPDYVLILAWNLKEEICQQLEYVKDWGGKFVTAIPRLEIW